MKKMIALLLAAVMTFAMVGCASGPDILGMYETTFDMTESLVTEFDATSGLDALGLSLGDYIEDCSLTLYFNFLEDGTYELTYNEASLDTAMKKMEDAMVPLLDDMLYETIIQTMAAQGVYFETKEEVAAVYNMTWDDLFVNLMGYTPEIMAAELMAESRNSFDVSAFELGGNYKAEDGKLYMTNSPDMEIDESAYETYEIDGDVVTLTSGVNIEATLIPYPFTLTKVS